MKYIILLCIIFANCTPRLDHVAKQTELEWILRSSMTQDQKIVAIERLFK